MNGAPPRRLRQLVAHVAPAAGKDSRVHDQRQLDDTSTSSPWANDAFAARADAYDYARSERIRIAAVDYTAPITPGDQALPPSIAELNKDDIGPTDYEEYLFDLRGYLLLKGAVSPEHVAEINAALDAMPLNTMRPGDWWGHVHGHSYGVPGGAGWDDGLNLQQI